MTPSTPAQAPPAAAAAPHDHPTGALTPWDEYNQLLVANVHPADWINPKPTGRYNLVVIGAGTAGLVTAIGAAGLGAKVALIERHLLGGDCLTVGCVPSKCLIRSSRAAAAVREAERFGVSVPAGVQVDFGAVMERMRKLRAGISDRDSARRFRDAGVDVFIGAAAFSGPDTITVGDQTLRFRRAVIATGARAVALAKSNLTPDKIMTAGAVVMLIGGFLMTHITADVPDWELWTWMLILGLGIGPAMAGFTVVVQNSVSPNQLGVATSTLTFLRQIGASVGLAAAGTIFSSSFANRLPTTLAEAGVPQPLISQLVKLSGALQNVGNGRALLEHILTGPQQALIPKVIAGANNALALAIADLFWITIVSGVLGLACTLLLRDRPLRSATELRSGSLASPELA